MEPKNPVPRNQTGHYTKRLCAKMINNYNDINNSDNHESNNDNQLVIIFECLLMQLH